MRDLRPKEFYPCLRPAIGWMKYPSVLLRGRLAKEARVSSAKTKLERPLYMCCRVARMMAVSGSFANTHRHQR